MEKYYNRYRKSYFDKRYEEVSIDLERRKYYDEILKPTPEFLAIRKQIILNRLNKMMKPQDKDTQSMWFRIWSSSNTVISIQNLLDSITKAKIVKLNDYKLGNWLLNDKTSDYTRPIYLSVNLDNTLTS